MEYVKLIKNQLTYELQTKECKFCFSNKLVKSENVRDKQRYCCKSRGKNQAPGDRRVRYGNKTRYLALSMYLNSAGFRSIGRVLGVPFQLAYHWVSKAGELVEERISK